MIKFQTNHRSRDVVFLKGKFHEFGTEHSIEVQDVAVGHRLDDRQVGATYEDNFLREDLMKNVIFQVTSDINEPVTINEAFSGEHSAEWKKATRSEYDSHMGNHTMPRRKNIVGSG